MRNKKNSKAYWPIKKPQKRKNKFGAFDFETLGLGGDLLCVSWYIEGTIEATFYTGTPNEIVDYTLRVLSSYPEIRWYAHNAQYDWRYIIDEIILRYPDSLELFLRTDNDIFMIVTEEFTLVDSYAIWPHSLRSLLEYLTPELPKLNIDFSTTTFDPTNPEHIEYAKRDSEGLVKALVKFDQYVFDLFEVRLALTLASTALTAWKHTIEQIYWPPTKIDEFVRLAYFGGFVAPLDVGQHTDLKTYDINSSYPHCMREFGVPYGTYAQTDKFIKELPGVYHILVKTPDDIKCPVIPKRFIRGESNHVVWPIGNFETYCTSIEIDFARSIGYEIEVIEGVIWDEIIYPFTDIVDICESIRKDYKGTPLETIAKLVQNSLYGKFGSKKTRTEIYIPKDDEDFIGAEPCSISQNLWIRKRYDEDILSLPQWAVFITAQARVNLLTTVYEIGVDNVVYCDTDSITTKVELPNKYLGPEYGKFKLEKTWKRFRAIAPKVYAGVLSNGKTVGAAKGLPRNKLQETDFIKLLEFGETEIKDISILPSLKVFLKGNRETRKMDRKSTDTVKSKGWRITKDSIEPVRLEQ